MSRRLTSVSLANWRGGDPRARRRFVTALGDALREQGGVAVEGVVAEPTAAVEELLGALAEYFGLEPMAFVELLGPAERGREVVRLSQAATAGSVAVGDQVARGGIPVLTAGAALEQWTAGVVRAHDPVVTEAHRVDVVWSGASGPLPEFQPEV